jgi:formate C-acetyltransferase
LLVTKLYQETDDVHPMKRRALSLKKILDNMTQHIWDDELIVGSHGSNGRRSAPVFPEFAIEWLDEELDGELESRTQDTFIVPQKVKDDLRSIMTYWEKKTVYDKYRAILPDDTKRARDSYMFTRDLFERNGYGHAVYQLDKLLKAGIVGLKQEVEEKIASIDLSTGDGISKKIFYDSLIIIFDAIIAYARRYSQKALIMASQESNASRRKELEKIADVCGWVPENPARDIWDGLQMIAFMQLIIQIETNGDSVSPGRMDQYLYPLYQKSIREGKYTIDEIQELLDCLWIKFNEIIKVQDSESIRIHPGFPMTPNVTIGGQTAAGEDAVNELSYLMLNAQAHIRLTNPQFTVRFFKGTPEDFKLRTAQIISMGTGMPALFGDEGCMEAMRHCFPEIPMERIRDYGIVGCVELAPKGFQGRVNGGFLNVARIVDLALNNGIDRLTGKQIGPKTCGKEAIKNFENLLESVRTQMAYFVKHQVINAAVVDFIQRENTPHLFLSSLIEGCIENGKDMTYGGSLWGATPIVLVGLATAADSLTAVKKVVFEEGLIDMIGLNNVLNHDFEGNQKIWEELLKAPKYGNDDDYADEVMRRMSDMFFNEIEKHKDIDGRPYTSMILTLGGTVPHGWKTGATADGRKSGMPVSDSMSPSNISRNNSPTSVLLSAGKISQKHVMEGNVVNLKFSKSALQSKQAQKKFSDLATVYFNDLKGQELQVNAVDTATLRDAQKNPDNHKDLIIRIAGYSARFIELAEELQNDIIRREEHHGI